MTRTSAIPGYAAGVAPILATKCTPCHIGNRTSGVEMTSYGLLTTSIGDQYGELVVQPGSAADSPIVNKISSDSPMHGARMPRDRAPLSSAEIQTISDWIDGGARDD